MKKLLALALFGGIFGLNTGCEQHSYEGTKLFNQDVSLGHGHGHDAKKDHPAPAPHKP